MTEIANNLAQTGAILLIPAFVLLVVSPAVSKRWFYLLAAALGTVTIAFFIAAVWVM